MSLWSDDVAYALALTGPGESVAIDGRQAERLVLALAIAQAVDEGGTVFQGDKDAAVVLDWIMRRADELMNDKP